MAFQIIHIIYHVNFIGFLNLVFIENQFDRVYVYLAESVYLVCIFCLQMKFKNGWLIVK